MCMYTPISHVISRKFSSILLSCHIYSHNLIESHETKQCWAFYFFTHNFASKILSVTIFSHEIIILCFHLMKYCSHSIFSVLFYLEVFYFINNVKWQFFFSLGMHFLTIILRYHFISFWFPFFSLKKLLFSLMIPPF